MHATLIRQSQNRIFQLSAEYIHSNWPNNFIIFIHCNIHRIFSMWKISQAILLSILLFILAFPNKNKATNQFGLKKVADIKLASPAAIVQTNMSQALKQSKKTNLLKSVALATMLAAGAMVGHNSHNNLMERNGGTADHIISKNGTKNGGLMESVRGYYENLKNSNIVSSKKNSAEGNLYGGKNWASKIDKGNIAKMGNGWTEHLENIRKMKEMARKKWNHGITNYLKETWIDEHINQIDIEICANIGKKMENDMKKIGEIMKKILEIDVNVKIDSMKNENGKNDGIGMQLKLHNWRTGSVEKTEIENSLLLDKDGKIKMNSVELGKKLIRQICGGNECDQSDDLLEFGANPCSAKPPPELDEMDRSLRPMLLKLGSKLKSGRLWTDNPMPDYKNGFFVAFEWEVESNLQQIDSDWLSLLKYELERFEMNAPIRFLELKNDKKESSKFKNRLHFVIHNGENSAKNGLQRNEEKNFIYLNAKELEESTHLIQDILLKALGVKAGEGLRIEYDRRDKFMPPLRRAFAQLNAAYGAENYSIQGQPFPIFDFNNNRAFDKPEVEFWMGPEYANFVTRKYEIPVLYDESFKEIANENQKLLEEVYANFAKNSVIQFVVHEKPPTNKNYVRIYRADKDGAAHADVGRTTKYDPSYQGEFMEFGKKSMDKYTLYHEFMHAAGMEHEHQRADVEQFLEVDREKAQYMWPYDDIEYARNFMPNPMYLPLNEYNPRGIMHYKLKWECFQLKRESDREQRNQELPSEPDQMDWENLNHFYGVGKGRTQFKVEIDENGQQKIVDDIDGMRRLKK